MTCHRVIRCDPQTLLRRARQVHSSEVGPPGGPVAAPRWRYVDTVPPGCATDWVVRLPDGSTVSCCLETERAANGVLAHLSVAAVSGRVCRLPNRVRRLVLQAWAGHVMSDLAHGLEADA